MANAANCVVFESNAFNTSIEGENFINPGCFGDDVARWLIGQLRADGHVTEEPRQEDFGWYFTSRSPEWSMTL